MSSPLSQPHAWNAVAHGYTIDSARWLAPYAADALRMAEVKPEEEVLDVAAGPGTLALQAAEFANVTAIDFAEAMIATLKERAREAGRRLEARVADGMELPFSDANFHAAFSMFGLMFFPDRDRGFRELRRVLRPGGRGIVSSWQHAEDGSGLARFYGALFADLPASGMPADGPPLCRPDALEREMRAAGFRDLEVRAVTHAMDAPTMRELLAATLRGNAPVQLLVSRFDERGRREYEERVLERLHQAFGEGPVRIEMPAWIALGRV